MENGQALDRLLEAATCPVCLERLSSMALVCCVNGHALCFHCRRWQPYCPTCRGRFSTDRNTTLRNIVQALPERCQNQNCNLILWDLTKHKYTCAHRTIKCVACGWMGPVKDLRDHIVKAKHPQLSPDVNRYITKFHKCISENFRWVNVFELDGHIFWRILENEPEISTLTMVFICIATKEIDNTYIAKISFESDKIENVIKVELSFENNNNENRVYLSHDMLDHFVKNNSKLLYKLTIDNNGKPQQTD